MKMSAKKHICNLVRRLLMEFMEGIEVFVLLYRKKIDFLGINLVVQNR